MKTTLSISGITDALMADEYACWSYPGARALAEYLDDLDEGPGEDTELDVVAIRCGFNEYESAADAYEQRTGEKPEGEDEDTQEDNAFEYLQNRTTVIEYTGGIIIQVY